MGFGRFFKNPFKATAAAFGLKKQYKRLTGEDQKEKAHERLRWAQNAYNEAGRLKQEYDNSITTQIKQLEEAFNSAIRSRANYDLKLSGQQLSARELENIIKSREQKLEHIGSDIGAKTSEYESALAHHKEEVTKFHEQGTSLQGLVDVFKKELPDLSKSIEEYQNLPQEFLTGFEQAKEKRSKLEGFSREERGKEIDEFEAGVNELKQKQSALEKAIKEKYGSLSAKREDLLGKHTQLTSSLKEYKDRQDQLIAKEDVYNRKRHELENIISG